MTHHKYGADLDFYVYTQTITTPCWSTWGTLRDSGWTA
jgi:hypothetical protein